MDSNALDQFFTKPQAARQCWKVLRPLLRKLTNKKAEDLFYVEPSAGDGAFYDLLPPNHRIGIDIAPRRPDFISCDFLQWKPTLSQARKEIIVVGNPPFGRRGDLAIRFVEKSAEFADTIAFIVPAIFRRYHIHRRLPTEMRWILTEPLPRDAFQTPSGRTHPVGAEFQVWTRLASNLPDNRLFTRPPTAHQDFTMWQYNNTKDALKMFANDFVFAVPCQGWQDYNRRETRAEKCEKHKQWLLFKPSNRTAYRRLHNEIDYAKLSQKNATTTPGFRKHDIVREYTNRYG